MVKSGLGQRKARYIIAKCHILFFVEHKIVRADPEDSLSYMLHEFQTGLSHIAIVREIDNSNAHADPKPVIRGTHKQYDFLLPFI